MEIREPDEVVANDILQLQVDEETTKAKERELGSWVDKGVFEEVADNGQHCMTTRWVIKPKVIDGKQSVKAHLCARGFEETQDFRTDSPTCTRESIRIALALIAPNSWTLNSIDIKTAFLQGKQINRTVYIRPPKEAQTKMIWCLRKCIYGLADAPRQWYLRVREEFMKLGAKPNKLDQGLFYWFEENVLIDVVVCFVDDMIWGGTDKFYHHVIEKLCAIFEIGVTNSRAFKYVGIDVFQNQDNSITISQNNFCNSINPIDIPRDRLANKEDPIRDNERTMLRGVIGQLNWLAGISRLDISFDVCQASTRIKDATVADVLVVNKIVRKIKNEPSHVLFPCLDLSSAHLKTYTDASLNNLPNGGSQGGTITFLCDSFNRCCPLSWSSTKIKRVVRSTLAAETLALVEGSETAMYLSELTSSCLHGN